MTASKISMNIRKYILMLLIMHILFVSGNVFSIDSVDLEFRYFPNSSMNVASEVSSDMELYFEGDESALPKDLKGKLPAKITSKNISLHNIVTGKESQDGSFTLEVLILRDKTYASVNGSRLIETPASGKMEGIKISGIGYPDGNMKYLSTKGAEKEFEKITKAVFDQLADANLFAAENIKIGESTSKTFPIQIPIKTDFQLSLSVEVIYTLVSIEQNIAYFDVTHNALMSSQMKSASIDSQVSGEGVMTYDIDKKYSPEFTSKMILNMSIPLQQGGVLKIISIADSKSDTKFLN